MRLTDLCTVNRDIRLWRKGITLQASIDARHDYYLKHNSADITPLMQQRLAHLKAQIQLDITRLDRDELISRGSPLMTPVQDHMRYLFPGLPEPGPAQHDALTKALVTLMNNKGKDARAAAHKFNVSAETAYRTSLGWYIIFNTLTVRPGAYYAVFNKDSTEWKDYVRTVQREINEAETGHRTVDRSRRILSGENHTYFATVEEGGTNGRLHIHVLHYVRTLPVHSHDPNRGRARPIYRELGNWRGYWRHGTSSPIAARFSPQDAYGQAGWRWPIDARTDDALLIRSPLALANYVSKYITKGYTSCKRAELLWRVRKTQGLGLPILQHLTSQLTREALIVAASDDSIKLKLNNTTIPPILLRQQALRSLQDLHSSTDTSTYRSTKQIARELSPRPSLLHSLRVSTTQTQENNPANIGHTLTSECSNEDTYKAARKELYDAARRTDAIYYRRSVNGYGKASTEDNFATKTGTTTPPHRV